MGEYQSRIKELPLSDQPRERLVLVGASALSDAELLAILLRVGVPGLNVLHLAQRLLSESGGWPGLLRTDHHDLCQRHGMGAAKAATVKAALEIGRRLLLCGPDERMQIKSPADAATLLMVEMGHLDQEHLRAVLLDTKNRVQQVATIYIGSVNSAQVRVGEIFKEAIRRNSAALIVAHNHPSGDPTPSPEDVLVTRQIVEAGKLLDVECLDHLVIGRGRYVSMRERGLGFTV
ncbi:MAG: JAB domain-containing protein [Candidatus Viridilinea halotolerans]|uniref:JAB domain-containing protein n=1 Tax=Candidatus Viridilinea halotolerans TaxID=2491704 RepID=A0A426TVW0_9CHLR|nr:MAG: JAB domain-containing protein [Candidatus Viridilinea halotolerans]